MSNGKEKQTFNYEIDLSDLFKLLIQKRYVVSLIILFFSFFSVVYSLSLPNVYKSSAILVVVDESSGGANNLLSRYGDLAGLAGINLPSGAGENKSDLAIEKIKSRDFTKHLITYEGTLENILASESYNPNNGEIKYDTDIFDGGVWVREAPKGREVIPSYIEAHDYLMSDVLNITKDRETGFITLTIQHVSPSYSKELLELIIQEINAITKLNDQKESRDALAYLNKMLQETKVIEVKKSINELIQNQLETLMLTNIKNDYFLTIIDAPFLPEEKSSPSRAVISIIGFLLGILFSLIYLVVVFLRSRNN